jgi:hypothetical protein
MADTDLTTVQIDKETLALIKELAQADMRSATKEISWLAHSELTRRNGPTIEFTGRGDEIGNLNKGG